MVGAPKRFSTGRSDPEVVAIHGNEPTPDMDGAKTGVAVGVEWRAQRISGLKG